MERERHDQQNSIVLFISRLWSIAPERQTKRSILSYRLTRGFVTFK